MPDQVLADIARECGDTRGGGFGLGRVAEHEAVILHRGAAARGVDDHGVQPRAVGLAGPGRDVGAGTGHAPVVLPHMMGQRAAAPRTLGHHHLDAQACQQSDGGGVDLRVQHLLRAAREQRHAAAPSRRAAGCAPGCSLGTGTGQAGGGKLQHGAQPLGEQAVRPAPGGANGRARAAAARSARRMPAWMRQHGGQHRAQGPLVERSGKSLSSI